MMWGYCWPVMWGWGVLLWLVPLGLVTLLFWAVNRSEHRYDHHSDTAFRGPASGDSAIDIVRQRFAKGEITEEEYERLRGKLVK